MTAVAASGPRPTDAGFRRRMAMRRSGALLGVTALAIGALNVVATADPTATERILASLVVALAAWVAAAWARGAAWTSPFLVLFTGLYAVYFGLPIFVLGAYTRASYIRSAIPDEYIEEALRFSFAGLVVCVASYRLMGLRAISRRLPLPALRLDWDAVKVRRFGVASGIGGVVAYGFFATTPVPLAFEQLAYRTMDLSLLGILMLWALQLCGQLGRGTTLLLWLGLVPARFGLGLATGLWTEGIHVGLVLLVGYCLARNRFPWRPVVVGAAALLILAPVRGEFRERAWGPLGEKLSLTERALLYPGLVTEYVTRVEPVEAIQATFSRVSHLMTFAEVVEKTPGMVPYANGETYYSLLFTPIPRFVYPDKPTVETGQWFGHRYGFLDEMDTTTSHNLPQLIELYVNFGGLGVILGMFVLGVAYAVVVGLFVHRAAGLGALVMGAYVLEKLLLIESSAALVFGGLVWDLVFVGLIHGFVRVRRAGNLPLTG
jgi:hypothetical protein